MKTIAVFFGGRSAEHDVSIITAFIPVINTLLASGEYDVWPVYIAKDGSWYSDKAMNDLEYFRDPTYEEKLTKVKKLDISLNGGLTLIWPGFLKKEVKIDVAFPAMHGTYGEDGSLMGLLRMANVAFVGCDIFASAVAMDKAMTKQIISAEGVPVVPYVWFTRHDWAKDKESIRAQIGKLNWPLFVKPVHLGSSIAITKVKKEEDLDNAIEVALHYDDKVLVEESVENLIEVTLPIMGGDEPTLAHIEKPNSKADLFDFQEKYIGSGGQKGGKSGGVNNNYSEIPAQIEDALAEQVRTLGKSVWRILGGSGTMRVDFLINGSTKQIYVNEVNLLPGSLYEHNWRKAGVSNRDLVLGLVKVAEERFSSQKNTTYTFSSEILKVVGGPKMQHGN